MHTITAGKTMLTVFLNIDGVILINWFTPGKKIQQRPLLRKILGTLAEILQGGRAAQSPRPTVHFDNTISYRSAATEHYFQLCQFGHAPSPLYSPDISPCDFCLFDGLKRKRKRHNKNPKRELKSHLVSSRPKQRNELMSTGSRDYSM
jgi:hypothetical protein